MDTKFEKVNDPADSTQRLYDERLKRVDGVMNHYETDRIPVMANVETWAAFYSGKKVVDIQSDEEEFACFDKVFTDFWFDCAGTCFFTHDTKITNAIGGRMFFYSEDGITIQYRTSECHFMEDSEYPQLISDPIKYTKNVDYKRRFPALSEEYPQNLEALKEAFSYYLKYIQKAQKSSQYYKQSVGMPTIIGAVSDMPVDMIHDYYRGMKDSLLDVRRRPQMVIDAAEALMPIVMQAITYGAPTVAPFPYVFFPLHMPTYLNKRQFEKIYYPTFKKVLDNLHNMGGKAYIALEGNMEHTYDYINDLPKNFAVCAIDDVDIRHAKKIIGDTVGLMGGVQSEMLKYSTKEECIDAVKDVLDVCAPGGGFVASTTRVLLAPNDVKTDNLKAVNEFIHNYKG